MAEFEHTYDDRAESFKQIGDVIRRIAEDYCDITIDDTTHQRWRELLALLREVDTMADDTYMTSQEVINLLRSFEIFNDRYPQLSPDVIGVDIQQKLLNRTERLLELGALMNK